MNTLYFSWIREKIGKEKEIISPPSELKTLKEETLFSVGRSSSEIVKYLKSHSQ